VEEFYRLLAHIALEDCYLENGARILQWRSDDEADVPPPSTLRKYARQFEVEHLEEKFLKATCALLEREGLLPEQPVHLAFDITKVHWYGKHNEWVSSSRQDANTTQYWHYAILSVANPNPVTPDRNYVLGATPIKNRTEQTDALRRLLRRVSKHSEFNIGRVYCDRQLYQKAAVEACRAVGADCFIQAKKKGVPGKLIEETDPGEHDKRVNIEFAGLPSNKRVNAFVSPINPGEIGAKQRDPHCVDH